MIHLSSFRHSGYALSPALYSSEAVDAMIRAIEAADTDKPTFRRGSDVFAIRQVLKEVPALGPLIFTKELNTLIIKHFSEGYQVVKSIYFDKPGGSNWFVIWHQDLTISVAQKADVEGFGPWTVKQNQFAVQPPVELLTDNFTLRIHLDDTDERNGALRVVPGSHRKGIYRPETIDWSVEKEVFCPVPKGGVMAMHPLLLHASSRTTDQRQRRVIHLEFSRAVLPNPLQWSEGMALPAGN